MSRGQAQGQEWCLPTVGMELSDCSLLGIVREVTLTPELNSLGSAYSREPRYAVAKRGLSELSWRHTHHCRVTLSHVAKIFCVELRS